MTAPAPHVALLLAGALASAPIAAARVELADDEQRLCAEQGGCEVVTGNYLRALARDAFEAGRRSCAGST